MRMGQAEFDMRKRDGIHSVSRIEASLNTYKVQDFQTLHFEIHFARDLKSKVQGYGPTQHVPLAIKYSLTYRCSLALFFFFFLRC